MAGAALGLDLGANSIGWALVDEASQQIIASGVRIFPEGVDNFDTGKETSKSESRRTARGMRRQIARRARRKRRLREGLTAVGLLPTEPIALQKLLDLDPYMLRQRALHEKLSPHEIGRLLLHLNQRRGFLSNRKSDRERKKETQGMLAEINELAGAVKDAECRTVGEYFAKSLAENQHQRVRGKHTRRDMFEEEFETVWQAQRQYHPELLTDKLKYGSLGKVSAVRDPVACSSKRSLIEQFGVYGLIFFQRPMYWPRSVVGQCELEPKRKRCPRADRLAQRFRLLQEVNNLRFIDPATGDEHQLTAEQRTLLIDKLAKTKEMSFDQIRKALGFIDSIPFNLEAGSRSKLLGMLTDATLADKKLFGPAWHKRAESEKTAIARALIHGDEAEIRQQAKASWGVDDEVVERLLDVDLQAGYARHSIAALERLLPHMERGLLYMTGDGTPSALSEAGYLRPDQRQRNVLELLPEPPDIANPVVRQALYELRKVVNAIIKKYGKPTAIHLELARNATVSSEERRKMSKRMRDREAERDYAADEVRALGYKVTRDAIDRLLLWKEQGEVCMYSPDSLPISQIQLFSGEVHIDHILPYSRCLDDSFANKVVCFVRPNADKLNQTPYQWLAARDPVRFETIRQRAMRLPYNKRKRFTQKELDLEQFIERQLNDTRYISRAAMEYLRTLYAEPHHVLCPKGNHTASFRWLWGLNTVLHDDGTNKKSRADHRHHAIDAIVIALTDRKRLLALTQAERYGATVQRPEKLDPPWPEFRASVEQSVAAINVSHRVRRRVAGALHKETLYGPTPTPGEFVVRKPIESLTPAMIDDIRDPAIRQLVIERLASFGIKFGRAAKDKIPKEVWSESLYLVRKNGRTTKTPVPIRKVRLIKTDQTILPIRDNQTYVKPGSTHHLSLFEWEEKGKRVRDTVPITMLEAIGRLQRREPLISRIHPKRKDARFLMSLSAGESVILEHEGREVLCVFITAASTTQQMIFRAVTVSGRSDDNTPIRKQPNTFHGRKVTVSPLGEIRWAND